MNDLVESFEREIRAPASLTLPSGRLNPAAIGWATQPIIDTAGLAAGRGRNKRHSWLWGAPTSTRTTFVIHSDYAQEMQARFPQHRSTGELLPFFDVLASVSKAVMEENQTSLKAFGVDPSVHALLPNAINVEDIRVLGVEDVDADIAAWTAGDQPVIIMVGRLSAEKNHLLAIDALAKVKREDSVVPKLLILGAGPTEAAINERVHAHGLEDHVFWQGKGTILIAQLMPQVDCCSVRRMRGSPWCSWKPLR